MRKVNSRSLSVGSLGSTAIRVSTIGFALTFPAAPVLAQSDVQQPTAEPANAAVDCLSLVNVADRQSCLDARGNVPDTAADGARADDAIIVTGSRIPRPNYDTVQPSTVLNSQAIEQRGFVNAADALNELPQFGIPGSSPVGPGQGGPFGSGQSFVNFLGLGSQRTLVLVNGRRFVSSNSASIFSPTSGGEQVDLGLINTKLIDRIETIAIGGAPIYGSDAIAGTINVVLKTDYDGIDVDGQDGISQRGDAHNYRLRALAGKNFLDGRANLTFSAEYNKGDGLTFADRAVTRNANFYANCNPGSKFNQCLYPDGPRVHASPVGGAPLVFDIFGLTPLQLEQFGIPAPVGPTDANGTPLFFGPDGQLIPQVAGVNPGGPDEFSFFSSGGNGFAYVRDTSNLLTQTQRWNANLIGHYDITDNIRLFAEGWYSHTKGTNLVTQPEYNSGAFCAATDFGVGSNCGNLVLSVDNPFLTSGQRTAIIDAIDTGFSDQNVFGVNQDYFYLSRANTDIASGRATSTDDIYRIVVGLDGKFELLAGTWKWEIVANRGIAKSKGTGSVINTQNLFNALDAVRGGNGNIICRPGYVNSPFPTLNSTCAPLNVFGSGQASQESIDYVLSRVDRRATNKQFVLTADVSGALFRLPGGDLSIAVGAEHRAESVRDDPGGVFHGPDPDPQVDENGDGDPTNDVVSYSQFVPILPIRGGFHTNEVFAELDAGIIGPSNNVPFVHSLNLQAAARLVDHSVAGSDVTWTLGARFTPVRDFSLRGNYTHAIRSPSIRESFVPTSSFFGFAVDPCDRDQLQNGPDPAIRQANCAAAGIPTNFQSNSDDTSFLQQTGGNPDLANEKSNAYSLGAVLTPRFVPHLNVTVDYISVRLKQAISSFTASQIVNSCYDAPNPATNPFCSLFVRHAPGPAQNANQLAFVKTSFFNADELRYRGIVAAWDYKLDTPFLGSRSSLSFSGSYQHLLKLATRAFGDQAPTNNDGTLGYPKDSFSTTVNYYNEPVSAFANFNYTGPVDQGVEETVDFREHQRLNSFLVVNSGFRFDINKRFRFSADVENVFDIKPPFPVPAGGGAITYFPGVLGRFFRVGAGVRF